ncbi:MAG: hypothetical protein LJE62_05240, partial [Silicimonas sp.]|nr:hypothetical protein [Silicimonas sp.]
MRNLRKLAISASLLAVTATSVGAAEPPYDAPVSMDLAFVYHLDADMPEQDVFIERTPGSGEVFRVTKKDRDYDQPIFAAANAVPHSPFDPETNGPHEKGEELGLTLGEWLGAGGRGSYSCDNGEATINAEFNGLVPEGIYTMWHFFMAVPPTDPFIGTYDLPTGARDGSESTFEARADGSAHV